MKTSAQQNLPVVRIQLMNNYYLAEIKNTFCNWKVFFIL